MDINNRDYYYDNNYGYSNQNYNNYRDDKNNYGSSKGYSGYNKSKPQFKEVEVKDKNEKEKYDKTEIPEYVKQINDTIDDSELKSLCEKDKETIKIAENECPIDKYLMLYDISIAIKGPEEELAYLKHPNYISIIRRGNTLMKVYDKYKGEYHYKYSLLIRKGMKKFIDLFAISIL